MKSRRRRVLTALVLLLCLLLSGCGEKKHEVIRSRLDVDAIPDCYETNRNIFGEQTGLVFKCGDLIFYSQYTYTQLKYKLDKSDGLYVADESGELKYKLADGIICGIVVREDGVYYLKDKLKGDKEQIYLYNFDLYRYSFETGKNELIISDCSCVQFSTDAVYYCPQYLSYKDFYTQYNMPLDLENEGKIVRHSLLTGEETVVAEVEGGIYHFDVADGIIAFTEGGDYWSRGRNLYTCGLDGSGLRKLTEKDQGEIGVHYVNKEENLIIFSGSSYRCMALDSMEVLWSYPVKNLNALGAYGGVVLDGKLFLCWTDGQDSYDKIACLDPREPLGSIKLMEVPRRYKSLYVFDGKLYAAGSIYSPGRGDPTELLMEVSTE